MYIYYSTFVSGFENAVKDFLIKSLDKTKIVLLLDGLVVYTTTTDVNKVKELRFVNNTFILIKEFSDKNLSLDLMLNELVNNAKLNIPVLSVRQKTFRIITSKENQLSAVDNTLLIKLEEKIKYFTKYRTNRKKPDIEFWILLRSEGRGFFGMRITHNHDSAKSLQQGELRPEVTNILCQLSDMNKTDVFLDPFVGSGAIPIERVKINKYTRVIATDNDKKLVNYLQTNVQRMNLKIEVYNGDALVLPSIANNSIDKIVTDPPWGIFNKKSESELNIFYTQMLQSFFRVLKPGGVAVVLLGQRELFLDLLKDFTDKFILEQNFSVLISGKKAGVYKIIKK
ncbi:MAG TPA: hypothetical protein DEB09_00515 [Candidatus Magasanikbacteria bacterium]|nr:hypothetical protein [Candidatus Magasanikbacteria bacterium]